MSFHTSDTIADDILYGAPAIAKYTQGSDEKKAVRRVYHWAEIGAVPIFRIGTTLAARKSELQAHFSAQAQKTNEAV